jgi:urease accessory protein
MSVSVFCLSMLRQVWPDRVLDWLSEILCERHVRPALAVLPAKLCRQFGDRRGPTDTLGQTDGQLAISELEEAVLAASVEAETATIDDLGSAAFMVDLASMEHETQYTRLFRS